ncbi:HAD family hydrolase [Arcticibacterium luteifluviistationis]|uniref:Phosphatase n=1 Tax=Arcticibacterium luteifluviistationis TaxID=1784714 RepID=A0A2Z4GG35_9BACT|nr:HAD family hydrolase [Arcticibacterium luteifluviistationis]AWW00363.1 phosphatase [Arcticibacterium luteifluviistationis]
MVDISLVVFDMAGTTVRDKREVETCFSEACKDTGLDVSDERILELQGYAKRDVFELLWRERLTHAHELQDYVDLSYNTFCEILENHYEESEILPTEHCLETFDILKRNNIKIALTTGFYRKVTNIILDKLGWLDGLNDDFIKVGGKTPIDISVTPSEVAGGRPKPYMIERAIDFLHISEPSKVVKVGDTPVDLEEGYNAKVWKSLAVTNGSHSHQQLSLHKNDGLLNNLADLSKALNLDVQKERRNFVTF